MAKQLTGIKLESRQLTNKGKIDEICSFLNENYEIKVNEFNPQRAIINCKTIKYPHEISVNDISLHAMNEGLSVSDSILRKILSSPNYTNMYNPILEYFESLKNSFSGKSHIDYLCNHLTARNFGEKNDNDFYQNRLNYIIKKWLVAVVACVYNKQPNDVALGLAESEGGMGKTFLFEFIIPDHLKEYYIKAEKDTSRFSLRDAITSNLIVNYEELEGLNSRTIEDFKAVLSSDYLHIKRKGEISLQRKQRIGSVTFSTNKTQEKGGFMHMSYSLRRFGLIELTNINHGYSKLIDIDQLWSEALTLFRGNYDYIWNRNDYEDFKQYNKRYIISTPAIKIIELYYEPVINEDNDTKWLQPSEIIIELMKQKRLSSEYLKDITAEKIGEALRTLNFQRKSIRRDQGTRYCYLVKNKL